MTLPPAEKYRLQLLARIIAKEIKVFAQSDERLYGVTVPAWTVTDLVPGPQPQMFFLENRQSFLRAFSRLAGGGPGFGRFGPGDGSFL